MESPDAIGRASVDGRPPFTVIYLRANGTHIQQAMFQTFGCGVSIAACSALTELARGKSVVECQALEAADILQVLGSVPEHRKFCVELAIDALRDALARLPKTHESSEP